LIKDYRYFLTPKVNRVMSNVNAYLELGTPRTP
jgi:hypothetical protein